MKKLNIAQKGKYLEILLRDGIITAVRPGALDAYLQERGFKARYEGSYGVAESRRECWRYFSPIAYPEHYQKKTA